MAAMRGMLLLRCAGACCGASPHAGGLASSMGIAIAIAIAMMIGIGIVIVIVMMIVAVMVEGMQAVQLEVGAWASSYDSGDWGEDP